MVDQGRIILQHFGLQRNLSGLLICVQFVWRSIASSIPAFETTN